MKVHASITLLLFNTIFGVLASNNSSSNEFNGNDLYVFDGAGNLINLDMSIISDEPNVTDDDLPNKVFFYLYTRETGNVSQQLYIGNVTSLKDNHFDPKKLTKFVTHGWQSSCKDKVCVSIREAFLKNGDYNVIEIDWSKISMSPYLWASNQVVKVAKYVAKMIDFLAAHGLNTSDVTVVGHSLGAHIAGLSSYYAKNKVYYVVALDAARPNFDLAGTKGRVSKVDADYVEGIHTTNLIGVNYDVGDSDFYANDGILQPGCGIDLGQGCSHLRSFKYYAESINHKDFLALKCDNFLEYTLGLCNSNMKAYMGGVTPDLSVQGRYFFVTNSQAPYGEN